MNRKIYEDKRNFFDNGSTLSYDFRIKQLKNLKIVIQKNESNIIDALKEDLYKPEFESYTAEVGSVYQEINTCIKNLRKWMKRKRVSTPIFLQPGKSYIYPEPKGVVLIISPWNYPFQLAISPMIGAIAAGNCIILKASHKSSNVEKIISNIIKEAFDSEYISVLEGPSADIVDSLITSYRLDHIFFTGSTAVGKKIMSLASKSLTPVTLELGGKSPAIVYKDANIKSSAKALTWGKFYNAGQTCIAPDYLLVHKDIKNDFIEEMKKCIQLFYGEEGNNNLSRIINEDRFHTLMELLDDQDIIVGGNYDREDRFISPTIIDNITLDNKIMKEEIFGPILPVLIFENISEIEKIINRNPFPLSLYLFTRSNFIKKCIIERVRFGGGCINDTISHIINQNLPFGGIAYSGVGAYHGKYSFDEFSHKKSIYRVNDRFNLNLKFPPYDNKKLDLVKRFLK